MNLPRMITNTLSAIKHSGYCYGGTPSIVKEGRRVSLHKPHNHSGLGRGGYTTR